MMPDVAPYLRLTSTSGTPVLLMSCECYCVVYCERLPSFLRCFYLSPDFATRLPFLPYKDVAPLHNVTESSTSGRSDSSMNHPQPCPRRRLSGFGIFTGNRRQHSRQQCEASKIASRECLKRIEPPSSHRLINSSKTYLSGSNIECTITANSRRLCSELGSRCVTAPRH